MKEVKATVLENAAKQGLPVWEKFRDDEVLRPMEITTEFLMNLLNENKNTEFGRKYHFSEIKTIEDYQRNVPVTLYDDYAPYIERMTKGETGLMVSEYVSHFNTTSGTVGNQKLIPMTNNQRETALKYNRMAADGLLYDKIGLGWTKGKCMCTSEGNAVELDNGITIGCASSQMAKFIREGNKGMGDMLAAMFTSPVEAMCPGKDNDTKYLHCRFALMEENVSGIIATFFSCITLLFRYIEANWEMLVDDIEKGTINEDVHIADEFRESLARQIVPMPERAKQLRDIFSQGFDEPFVPKIWPGISYIQGVGGDGFAVFDKILKEQYTGKNIHTLYSGITASEGLWTIPFDLERTDSVIAPGASFIEFLPVDAGDDFTQCVTMDKLEVGKIYELIVTTPSGFYRYRMSDAVKVTGKFGNTPTVEFMYRVNKTVNLVCEKTTEAALTQAVMNTSEKLEFPIVDYTLIPNTDTLKPRYDFYIEAVKVPEYDFLPSLRKTLEEELCKANVEYAECFEEKDLMPLTVSILQPETYMLYRDVMVTKGISPSQLKPVHVAANAFQEKFFARLTEDGLSI